MNLIKRSLLALFLVVGMSAMTAPKADAASLNLGGYSDALNGLGLGGFADWLGTSLTSVNDFMGTYGSMLQSALNFDLDLMSALGIVGIDPGMFAPLTDLLRLVDTICNTNLTVGLDANIALNMTFTAGVPTLDFRCSPSVTATANVSLDFNVGLHVGFYPIAIGASSSGGGPGIPLYGSLRARSFIGAPVDERSAAGSTPMELIQSQSVSHRRSMARTARRDGGGSFGAPDDSPGINRTWSCSDFSWKKQFRDMYRANTLRLYTEGISDGVAAAAPIALLQSYSPSLAEISMHMKMITALDLNSAKMECNIMAQTMENRFGETLRSPGYFECLSQFSRQSLEVALQVCGSPSSPFLGAEIDGKIASVGPLASPDDVDNPGASALQSISSDPDGLADFSGTDFIQRAVLAAVQEITSESLIEQGLSEDDAEAMASRYNSPLGRALTGRQEAVDEDGNVIVHLDNMQDFFRGSLGTLTVDNVGGFEFSRGDLKPWLDQLTIEVRSHVAEGLGATEDFYVPPLWQQLFLHGQLVYALSRLTDQSLGSLSDALGSDEPSDYTSVLTPQLEFVQFNGSIYQFNLNSFMWRPNHNWPNSNGVTLIEVPSSPVGGAPASWTNTAASIATAVAASRSLILQQIPSFLESPWAQISTSDGEGIHMAGPLTIDKWSVIIFEYISLLRAVRLNLLANSPGSLNWETLAAAAVQNRTVATSRAGQAAANFSTFRPMTLARTALEYERLNFYHGTVWPINYPFIANEVNTSLGGLNHPSVSGLVTDFLDHGLDIRDRLRSVQHDHLIVMNRLVGLINSYELPLAGSVTTVTNSPGHGGRSGNFHQRRPARVVVSP